MRTESFSFETQTEDDKNIITNILYESFDMKFKPLFKRFSSEETIGIIKASLNQAEGILYKEDDTILGVAVFSTKQNPGMEITKDMRKRLGLFSYHLYRWLFQSEKLTDEGIIKLEMIATKTETRGKGVGTTLIHKMIEYAKRSEYNKITLEVVNTNPRAKALYERMGFTTYKHHHTGIFTRAFDFSGFDDMSLSLR